MKELKPCPFCGCGGRVVKEHGNVYVTCYACGARSGIAYEFAFLPEENAYESAKMRAIENWNRRPKRGKGRTT